MTSRCLYNILFIVALLSFGHSAKAAEPKYVIKPDTSEAAKTQKIQKFYDSLEVKSKSKRLSRWIYDVLVIKIDTAVYTGKVVYEDKLYEPYRDKQISSIYIVRDNVVPNPDNRVGRLINSMHKVTRAGVIRRSLLFHEGDKLDPKLIVKNKELIDDMGFIYKTDIIVSPSPLDSTMVDLVIATQDTWTIGLRARLNLTGHSLVDVYDGNIMGFGHRLSVTTNFNLPNFKYGGNEVNYVMPNLFGTFFKGELVAGKDFDERMFGLKVGKEILRPTDYAIGGRYFLAQAPTKLICEDTTMNIRYRYLDINGVASLAIPALNNSVYVSARFSNSEYMKRPLVAENVNPAFQNTDMLLVGLGLYRERIYTSSLVYGYGKNEYLSSGYKVEAVGGYLWGEFGRDYYLGANVARGFITRREGYLMGTASLGGYLDAESKDWHRMALEVDLQYATPLINTGRTRIRHFTKLSHTLGWKRDEGCNEMLMFQPPRGLNGFTHRVSGQQRSVINLETVFFSPYRPYGFQLAFYSYCDLGLIGDSYNPFDNQFYSALGVGVRIKNSHLIFNALQLRLGIFLGRGGWLDGRFASLGGQTKLDHYRFVGAPPETIKYY